MVSGLVMVVGRRVSETVKGAQSCSGVVLHLDHGGDRTSVYMQQNGRIYPRGTNVKVLVLILHYSGISCHHWGKRRYRNMGAP